MTKAFQKYLQHTPRKELIAGEKKDTRSRKGEESPLAATSINRILATLRHFAGWLNAQRTIPTGNPFEGVKDIGMQDPAWNVQKPRELNRLRIACEQRMAFCTRADQNALLAVGNSIVLLLAIHRSAGKRAGDAQH
jgi:hypothetical protein